MPEIHLWYGLEKQFDRPSLWASIYPVFHHIWKRPWQIVKIKWWIYPQICGFIKWLCVDCYNKIGIFINNISTVSSLPGCRILPGHDNNLCDVVCYGWGRLWHCVAINLLWVRCGFTHTYNKHSNIKCTMGEWMDGYPGHTWLTHKFVEELLNGTTAPFSQPTSQQANNPHKPASNAINTIGINSLSKTPSPSLPSPFNHHLSVMSLWDGGRFDLVVSVCYFYY